MIMLIIIHMIIIIMIMIMIMHDPQEYHRQFLADGRPYV